MILRIKPKEGDAIAVNRLLTIDNNASNITVGASRGTVTFNDSRESYSDWYASFIHRKTIAMHGGGTVAPGMTFERGIRVYTHVDDKPYLKSIAGSAPDGNDNIQLLPGKTLDIVPADVNKIYFEQIQIPVDNNLTNILVDINRCIWYLYHTYNSFVYRMNVWSPETTSSPMFPKAHMLGTIQAYQAVVAAWNMRVWRRGFLWDSSPVRETMAFSVGYMALDCINPNVTCVVTISNVDSDNTIAFFTIYDQGISTNIDPSRVATTIKKTVNSYTIPVPGTGSDDAAANKEVWSKITIEIKLGELVQGEYYKAAFSLAVAQNETTALYYQNIGTAYNIVNVETKWILDNSVEYSNGGKDEKMRRLLLYKEEEVGDNKEEYII